MKRRALFVGVNTYDDPQIRDLQYAVADASLMNGFFAGLGYETSLLDNPKRGELRDEVERMVQDLGAGDLFMFYFAGHGFTQNGQHLLFCRDDKERFIRSGESGFKYDFLKELTATGCQRAFVLDACRSDFLASMRGASAQGRDLCPIGECVWNVATENSLAVMRSCGAYQCAQELPSKRQGLFTYALLKVLKSAKDCSRRVALTDDLLKAVAQEMQATASRELVSASQQPEFARTGIADIVLFDGAGALPPPAVPPPERRPDSAEGETAAADGALRSAVTARAIAAYRTCDYGLAYALAETADHGAPEIMWILGECFGQGRGCEKNPAKAFVWYRKAAERAHVDAERQLGLCYQYGLGCEKDAAESFKWYFRALNRSRRMAEQGGPEAYGAMLRVSLMLREGMGCEKNEAEADDWERRAKALRATLGQSAQACK